MKPMMKCGHIANGYRTAVNGVRLNPPEHCCVICSCYEQSTMPFLEDRTAICSCGKKQPSDPQLLAFFEYRGPGSRFATAVCECGYSELPHAQLKKNVVDHCAKHHGGVAIFVPRGPHKYDAYYCGHRGWD